MKKMNVNKEQISMSELENVNGGINFFKNTEEKPVMALISK